MTSVLVKLDENIAYFATIHSTHCWVALSLRIQTTLVFGVRLLATRHREGEPNDWTWFVEGAGFKRLATHFRTG